VIDHGSYYLYSSSDTGPYIAAGGGLFGPTNIRVRLVEPLAERAWTHLATTYDGQTLRLYVNGELANSRRWWSAHRAYDVRLNDIDLPFGGVVEQRLLAPLLRRDVVLRAQVTCGAWHAAAAPVFYVTAPGSREVINLLAEGDDLLVRTSTRANRLRLPSPDARVSGAFANCAPGQRLDITLTGPLQHPRATIDGVERPAVGPDVASGWAFVLHSELLPRWLRAICSTVWLWLLFVPFGLWARPMLATAFGIGLLGAALLLVPAWSHIDPVGAARMLAIAAAVAAGIVLRAGVRRRSGRRPSWSRDRRSAAPPLSGA
jgi:hypothetical protein